MDSNIGKKLDGRYELIELIGVGGMADIYRARDIEEDRVVAVKILKTEFAGSDEFLRRFRNESKAIALLSHPNIVKIYDVGFTEKVQFIVTVLHKPELLIFDEPFSGFDPINANVLKREILHLRDEGATVIFSTHNMASVEELCDNISLINKSHNILTGSVRELRREYSDNSFEFSFLGEQSKLEETLRPLVREMEGKGIDRDGFLSLSLKLNSGDDLREAIARANGAVDLRSFRQVLPSMDEIFIRSVEMFNQNNPQ